MASEGDSFETLRLFLNSLAKQCSFTGFTLRSDNAGTKNQANKKTCKKIIAQQFTSPYSPHQNGNDRTERSIAEHLRAILLTSKLLSFLHRPRCSIYQAEKKETKKNGIFF